MSDKLRIGILGASRIAEESVTDATAETGHHRYAVAARDADRAREYAEQYDYETSYGSYEELIADPNVDLVYIGLPNGLHATWTVRALEAGKNVLVEKPFAANLEEFDRVARVFEKSDHQVWEAFHHAHHPMMKRLVEIASSGQIGDLQRVEIHMNMPDPGEGDPRWNFDLAGGAVMDLGCYAIQSTLSIAHAVGKTVAVESVASTPSKYDERVDAALSAELKLGDIEAHIECSMIHDDFDFSLRLVGSQGSALARNFVKPQLDDVITVTRDGEELIERVGTRLSYSYQLEWVAEQLRQGASSGDSFASSREVMRLIDELYTRAGFPLRPASLTQ